MFKKVFSKIGIIALLSLSIFIFVETINADLETQLLVDVSPSTGNVPYKQTQWYGFSAVGGKGYCAILSPLTGNPNLFFLNPGFKRMGYSVNADLAQEKVWYGQERSGPMHLGCYGASQPSSNFTIQVITAPYLKEINPTSAEAGKLVTLSGFGFGNTRGTNYVKFGTVAATNYYSWTNTQIKVYVPSGVANGKIQVVVYVASRASNPVNFTASDDSSNGTMWRYDLGRTGDYPDGPTAFPLIVKWTYSATSRHSSSNPVIANNVLYVGLNDKLLALDAYTGNTKWSYTMDGNVSANSAPAIAKGIVYVGTSNAKFYALDANTGSLKWKYDAIFGKIGSSPAVLNGIVYFSVDKKLYALDANTGSSKWTYSQSSGWIYSSPTIADGIIYFGAGGKIYALYANNGVVKWIYNLPANKSVNDTLAFANGILYFGATDDVIGGGNVYALDTNTRTLKWDYRTTGWYGELAVADGKVYCYGVNYPGVSLVVLDANTGTELWREADGVLMGFYGYPTVSKGVVYVGDILKYYSNVKYSNDSKIYAFDANTGLVKWDHTFGNLSIVSSVEIANGKIYFVVNDRNSFNIYCFGQ